MNAFQNQNQQDQAQAGGNSRNSENFAHFTSARVAGPATYTPPYNQNGKFFRQKATMNVYQNYNGKRSVFRVTAFGKLADVVAKSCPAGKEVHITGRLNSYDGRVFVRDANGNSMPLTYQDGSAITTSKVGVTADTILLGNDSAKQIANEISSGMRPAYWNVPGHQDAAEWDRVKASRNSTKFQIGANMFGFAAVGPIPQGAQAVDPNTVNNAATQGGPTPQSNQNAGTAQAGFTPQQNVGTAQAGFAQPNQAVGNPGQVQTGFQNASNPAAPPQPVNVNGQNMGYAYQGNQAASGGQQVVM